MPKYVAAFCSLLVAILSNYCFGASPLHDQFCGLQIITLGISTSIGQNHLVGPKVVHLEANTSTSSDPINIHIYGTPAFFKRYGESPLHLSLHDVQVQDRLLYGFKWLKKRYPQSQVRVHVSNGQALFWICDLNSAPSLEKMRSHNAGKQPDLIVLFDAEVDELHEDPNLEFAGFVSELMFQQVEIELDWLWEKYMGIILEKIQDRKRELITLFNREGWPDPNSDEAVFARMSESSLTSQTERLVRTKIAMHVKVSFFEEHYNDHPELMANLRRWPLWRWIHQQYGIQSSTVVREVFSSLSYLGDINSRPLNRLLVDLLWDMEPPRVFELGLEFPRTIESIKQRGARLDLPVISPVTALE